MQNLTRLPLLIVLAGIFALSMMIPAIHASLLDADEEARAFFYWSLLSSAFIGALALATARVRSPNLSRSHLLALVGTFTLLPALAAMPMREVVSDTTWMKLYTEMVAALTTTGGSAYEPERLSQSLHLWRALVAWQGGLLIWIAAVAILAPMRLGGFEVTWSERGGQGARLSIRDQEASPGQRLSRYTVALAPIYIALTVALWVLLAVTGTAPTEAAIRAMSTLSTSGIVGASDAPDLPGEMAIFVFLFFAVSRLTFATDLHREQVSDLFGDREVRLAAALVIVVPAFLFLRHWVGAIDVEQGDDIARGVKALWGAAFTVLSFLTTTGFEAQGWAEARAWSGLESPAVLLIGLALFGGGVATTAGGAKLLRVYALYAHGRREMGLLVHPHAVGRQLPRDVRLPERGIEAAWVFLMLFATSLGVFTLALAATGLDFQNAMILAASALTTCGPLADLATATGTSEITDTARAIYCIAMVIGRLEVLALIALFNPDFWRR